MDNTIYTRKTRIFNKGHFNNRHFMKNNTDTSKKYWFDSQYYFVLLVIMFKIMVYCSSGVTKDLFVYKYDEYQKKTITKNAHIYHLLRYNQYVSLLHCDNVHYKPLIRNTW